MEKDCNLSRTRIVFVVNNAGTSDGRVVKSAKLALQLGYDVYLLGVKLGDSPARELYQDISVCRVTPYSPLQHLRKGKSTPQQKTSSQKPLLASTKANKFTLKYFYTTVLNIVEGCFWAFLKITGLRAVLQQAIHKKTFAAALKELQPDIIHCHDMWPLSASVKVKKEIKAKVIYDSHELEAHRNIDWSIAERKLWTRYEARLLNSVDGIVTVCESIAEVLKGKAKGIPVSIVYNSPWKAWGIKNSARTVREDCGLSDKIPLLLYVGYVTYNRGVEILLSSLKQLGDAHLAVVGPQRIATVEQLKSIANNNGTGDRVHFLPAVPQDEVISYVSTANVSGVFFHNNCLSHYYVLPNKFFESIFSGLPVVVPDFPELRKHVSAFDVGVICPSYETDVIVQSLKKAMSLKESQDWNVKVAAARSAWAYDNFLEEMREVYTRAIGRV
ncbi:glycosyltransferase [Halodesulfovibrio sp. MK-HDV]|jgi:glycosyltransferase involved in cell wall biosynthesis|uniref:glycosyltransferase n=1 Tax=Halodesulfovibrio sp. MK-HDV TaxID=2599925 RepID=UPI00136BF6DE|nr:glycosyltransferase [Halodesulfovibrio sp. MK-HDV]KAF1075600.1 D-inositol-3-phosphate glycosyltransferase [Halodesulfovibrio sp. MK-HDV]